jgi:uncharacterized protein YndB with AHSA1/START domain
MHTETPQLAISRVFDAPRELVYRAFTDPDHLAARWGPIGNSLPRDRTTSVAAGRRARHTTAGEGGSHIRLGSGGGRRHGRFGAVARCAGAELRSVLPGR